MAIGVWGKASSVGSGGIETSGAHLRSPCRFKGVSTTQHVRLGPAFGLRLLLFDPDSPATARSAAFHHGHNCIAKTAYCRRSRGSLFMFTHLSSFLAVLVTIPPMQSTVFGLDFSCFGDGLACTGLRFWRELKEHSRFLAAWPARVFAKGMIRRLRYCVSLPRLAWTR